jgi:2-polyprenyl-3-methyl-5-hydroxy-6-metoxy-1,4-benzoquinol methylase
VNNNLLYEKLYLRYAKAKNITTKLEIDNILKEQRHYNKHFIKKYFPKNINAVIIDLGAGLGGLVKQAKLMGYRSVSGIDKSIDQVYSAKIAEVDIKQGEIVDELKEMADDSVNMFILNDVIEHLSGNELLQIFELIYAKLVINGFVVIHTSNATSPVFGIIRYGDLTHTKSFTSESLTQIKNICNFQKIKIYELPPIIHGIKSIIRYVIWKLFSLIIKLYIGAETGKNPRNIIVSQNLICKLVK